MLTTYLIYYSAYSPLFAKVLSSEVGSNQSGRAWGCPYLFYFLTFSAAPFKRYHGILTENHWLRRTSWLKKNMWNYTRHLISLLSSFPLLKACFIISFFQFCIPKNIKTPFAMLPSPTAKIFLFWCLSLKIISWNKNKSYFKQHYIGQG